MVIQIIPAVLATSEQQYNKDISRLSSCEGLKDNSWIHIDFADNIFVQNKTVGLDTVSKFPADFLKEAHLMVSHPRDWIDDLVKADFKRVIFHIECEDNINEVIDLAKNKGLEVGLAIKIDTAIEKLEPFISKVDMVLVMSIVPGFQGQQFISDSLEKIKKIKSKWNIKISVDGAVNDNDAKQLVDAGVDNLIVGSYLLKGDIDENLEKLWEALNG